MLVSACAAQRPFGRHRRWASETKNHAPGRWAEPVDFWSPLQTDIRSTKERLMKSPAPAASAATGPSARTAPGAWAHWMALLPLMAAAATAVAADKPAAPAAAAPSTARALADPLQPQAVVPAATALSPFVHYRRHTAVEVQPGAWRAANDTVNRIGGWRTYAREAQAATPAASAPAGGVAPDAAGASTPAAAPAPAAKPAPATPVHRH